MLNLNPSPSKQGSTSQLRSTYDSAQSSIFSSQESFKSGDYYFTYRQQKQDTTPNSFSTFQYLMNKATSKSEKVTRIIGLPDLNEISDKEVAAVFMKSAGLTFYVLTFFKMTPDTHLTFKKNVDGIGEVMVDDLYNDQEEGLKHIDRRLNIKTSPETEIKNSVVICRLIMRNPKTKLFEGFETLLPDFDTQKYKVELVAKKQVLQTFTFMQAKEAGVCQPPPYAYIVSSGKNVYEINGHIKTRFSEFPSIALQKPSFVVCKFTRELKLKVLFSVQYNGNETFVVDGVNDKKKPRTFDMFTIKNMRLMRLRTTNSSFSGDMLYRPGMIFVKILDMNSKGEVEVLDTLFFGFKASDINLRFTYIDPVTNAMMLINTYPIPQSKIIILKKKSSEEVKKLSEEQGIPVDISKSSIEYIKKRRHHKHNQKSNKPEIKEVKPKKEEVKPKKKEKPPKEEVKPKKEEKPKEKPKPKIIEEYYYDDDEEEELEVRNITLVVDEDGNIVDESGNVVNEGGKGQNINEVLKKMNVEPNAVTVVEK